jgi:hypothetical protein
MNAERVSESDLMALAAHLHVQLRRRTGRVTDVEWLVANADYAQAIIQLAKTSATAEGAPELGVWAARFEMALMKVHRPRQPLLAALATAGAHSSRAAPSEMQKIPSAQDSVSDSTLNSQFSDSVVSEFGESYRKVDTDRMTSRKPTREAYVWSLR